MIRKGWKEEKEKGRKEWRKRERKKNGWRKAGKKRGNPHIYIHSSYWFCFSDWVMNDTLLNWFELHWNPKHGGLRLENLKN